MAAAGACPLPSPKRPRLSQHGHVPPGEHGAQGAQEPRPSREAEAEGQEEGKRSVEAASTAPEEGSLLLSLHVSPALSPPLSSPPFPSRLAPLITRWRAR